MKPLALVVVALLGVAVLLLPAPPAPEPGEAPPAASPPFVVCPLLETARRVSGVEIQADAPVDVTATFFSAGETLAEASVALEPGSTTLEVAELTAAARAPLLLDRGSDHLVAGSWLAQRGVAVARCDSGSRGVVVTAGGSTREGDTYTLLLTNPFGGVAVVDVTATSEIGVETESSLEGIVVPPRSLVTVELTRLLAGRQALSAIVTPSQGRVVAGAVHEGSGDVSATAGLEPSPDWWLPVPALDTDVFLVLVAPTAVETPFQLDVYDNEGVFEAAYEEVIPARGQHVVPVEELVSGEGAVRVVAAGPVVAVLWSVGEGVRAVVPGVPSVATSWWLPGAGAVGPARILVFNPDTVEVTVRVRSGGAEVAAAEVAASSLSVFDVEGDDLRLEADGEVAVTWLSVGDEGIAGDAGWAR